jgi:hypothetical protein
MTKILKIALTVLLLLVSCKEKNKMENYSIFPPHPIAIPFKKDEISQIFSVIRPNSIGLVYGYSWAICKIQGEDISIDAIPENQFKSCEGKALQQKDNDTLYVKNTKTMVLLNWREKKKLAYFYDISKSININLELSKILDYQKGIALSLFSYFDENSNEFFQFVIDDILNKKRLKEVQVPHFIPPLSVYFTPSFVFYQYNQKNYSSPWKAIDNALNEVQHPLIDLLNANIREPVFNVFDDNMLISEKLEHALIISYCPAFKKDMLFLAAWYGHPRVQPIVFDESEVGVRRLFSSPNHATMSPSGKWVYFCADGQGKLPDSHFIIYLDPALPNGYLPPFKLGIEGKVSSAGWMTAPEGLVLYKDAKLFHFDLSRFNSKQMTGKNEE